MAVKVRVIRKNRVEAYIRELRGNTKEEIKVIANDIRNTAITLIRNRQHSGYSGNVYKKGGVYHESSAEGRAPQTDDGGLVRNIAVAVDGDGYGASVISHAPYSLSLEFGTVYMAARPFMVPATEVSRVKARRRRRMALRPRRIT